VADQELTAGLDLGVQLAEVLADLGDFLGCGYSEGEVERC
jgi:hypothetical protein